MTFDHLYSGGGGGGGYFGGGGGGVCLGLFTSTNGSGGGGGSSYAEPTASGVAVTQGPGGGDSAGGSTDGLVTISWGFIPTGGPVPKSTLMRANAATNVKSCSCADPVNTATGNLAESINDLAVPGRGIPLNFSHSYNSLMAGVNGPLGYGWTPSYAMSLSVGPGTPPVTATVNQEDGTQLFYAVSGTAYTAPPWVQATLVRSGDGTWIFARRKAETFAFTTAGQLTTEQDRNGYVTRLTYASGQLTTVTDPAGRTLTLGWSGAHIVGVTDTASPPRSVTFGYKDGNGNLTDVVDAVGGHTVYTYDANHNLVTMRSPRFFGDTTTVPAPVTTNTYNGSNQVVAQVDPLGATTTFAYTPTSTTITDPNRNVEQQVFSAGILYSDTTGYGTPQAATSYFSYDPASLATKLSMDANGNVATATVDASGSVLTSTDALGRTTRSTYNAFNEPLTQVDPMGVTTTAVYDPSGNLLTSSKPLLDAGGHPVAAATVTYHYADPGHPGDVTSITDPTGHSVTHTYDAYGDVSSTMDAGGDMTTSTHDGIGRLTSAVTPNGNVAGGIQAAHTVHYTYDGLGRLLTEVDALGHALVHNVYDPNGDLVTATDADGNTTVATYNANGELTVLNQADHTTLKHGYDPDGNQITATDGAGNQTVWAFTDPTVPSKATSVTDPLGNTTAYTYDGVGNLVTKQDPGGNCLASPKVGCTTYGHDADNEQTSISYSDGITPGVSQGYNPDGQRVTMTDGTGLSSYGYDSLGRLTSSTSGTGATLGYGYDLAGHLTTLTYPGTTGSVSRSYDPAGRLQGVTDWLGHTTTFSYDADSNLTTESYPNLAVTTLGYDNADRMTSTSTSGVTATVGTIGIPLATYHLDPAGMLAQVGSQPANAYDPNRRLVSSTNDYGASSVTSTFGYDNAGNITQTGISGGFPTYSLSYNAARELTQMVGNYSTATMTYDARGNRVSTANQHYTTNFYTYNQANELTSANNGMTNRYGYNGDGLLMSRSTYAGTSALTWDVAEGMPLIVSDGTMSYITGPGGLPLEQISSSGRVLYYHQDRMGDTIGLTDASANTVISYQYYSPSGTQVVPLCSNCNVTNPFQFAGQYRDAGSGLICLRARFYDPATGQFLTRDPLTAISGSPYGYAGNNPLNAGDPTGLLCLFQGIGNFISAHRTGLLQIGVGLLVVGGVLIGVGVVASFAAEEVMSEAVVAEELAPEIVEAGSGGSENTIAVIGRQADTAVAKDWVGHEVLDLQANEWSLASNDEWVQSVVERKMDVYVGSNTTWGNLWDAVNSRTTVFGRELQQFLEAGYRWDGWYLRALGG